MVAYILLQQYVVDAVYAFMQHSKAVYTVRTLERTDPFRQRMNEHVPENKIKALHFALLASLGVRTVLVLKYTQDLTVHPSTACRVLVHHILVS
jgi:hypothetical protein